MRSVLGPTRVLGIDPGSRVVGWGVVERSGSALGHVAHGVLRLDPSASLELRLVELFARLSETLARHAPAAVAVEGVFTFKNARSALVLGQARGVALLVAARGGLPVFEYAPALVKRAIGVGGAGPKEAVARAVSSFLRLTDAPRADATDALAVAVCHLHRAGSPLQRRPRRAAPDLSDRLRPAVVRPARSGG
ncbi:MAG TPA: crossover junction endodeoxyribonuclease RuvC [Myxococcaceae bacterium]|nr:crossover junction endodeoxyribonuclease RuvC [Myxococcaceae bacterium]